MKERLKELEKEFQIQNKAHYKSDEQVIFLEGLKYALYILKKK